MSKEEVEGSVEACAENVMLCCPMFHDGSGLCDICCASINGVLDMYNEGCALHITAYSVCIDCVNTMKERVKEKITRVFTREMPHSVSILSLDCRTEMTLRVLRLYRDVCDFDMLYDMEGFPPGTPESYFVLENMQVSIKPAKR